MWPIPDPEALLELYRYKAYAETTYVAPANARQDRLRDCDALLERIESSVDGPRRRLLDVGCSVGELIGVAQRRGWSCTGIEVDPGTAQLARELTHADVRVGTVPAVLRPSDTFDLVVMSHSLEHSRAPREDFDAAVSHLRDGGLLFVRAPNASSQTARCMGSSWYWFIPPLHVSYFDMASLRYVADRASLRDVWLEYRGEGWAWFLLEIAETPARLAYRRRPIAGEREDEVHMGSQGPPTHKTASNLRALLEDRLVRHGVRLIPFRSAAALANDSEFLNLLRKRAVEAR